MIEVLKFYTSFCPPCHEVSRQLQGKEMTKINISKTPELATKHKVRSVPMLVFLKDNIEVHRHKGVITTGEYEDILLSIKDQHQRDVVKDLPGYLRAKSTILNGITALSFKDV